MATTDVQCCKCKKNLKYNEGVDIVNDPVIPLKVFKIIEDSNGDVCRFYEVPKDKRRLIGDKFIKYGCSQCFKL